MICNEETVIYYYLIGVNGMMWDGVGKEYNLIFYVMVIFTSNAVSLIRIHVKVLWTSTCVAFGGCGTD